jgi:hypothetical protein
MTKGDRDKLRAELAGKFVAAIIVCEDWSGIIEVSQGTVEENVARGAVKYADALMAELGIKREE